MSKIKKNELDVDFIGGQGSLTKDEKIAISEFLKAKKAEHVTFTNQTGIPIKSTTLTGV